MRRCIDGFVSQALLHIKAERLKIVNSDTHKKTKPHTPAREEYKHERKTHDHPKKQVSIAAAVHVISQPSIKSSRYAEFIGEQNPEFSGEELAPAGDVRKSDEDVRIQRICTFI